MFWYFGLLSLFETFLSEMFHCFVLSGIVLFNKNVVFHILELFSGGRGLGYFWPFGRMGHVWSQNTWEPSEGGFRSKHGSWQVWSQGVKKDIDARKWHEKKSCKNAGLRRGRGGGLNAIQHYLRSFYFLESSYLGVVPKYHAAHFGGCWVRTMYIRVSQRLTQIETVRTEGRESWSKFAYFWRAAN